MAPTSDTSSAVDQTAETPAPVPPPAPAKRSGKLLLIILLIAVLILLFAVVGIGLLVLMKKGTGSGSSSETPAETVAAPPPVQVPVVPAIDINKPPMFVPLDPFTVNLRAAENEEKHYLQADIALRVSDPKTADALKGWMPEMRNRVNLILTAKTINDIQNDMGQEKLQSEILMGLNAMFGVPPPPPEVPQAQLPYGPIQGVLFNSFIVQ